jgi:predicted acylesterase/phospholipase RssA
MNSHISSSSELIQPQRALVLQGGGALGAYEAGALKAFCEKLSKEDEKEARSGPLFNIVVGASIGAVNASILVDNVIHSKNKDIKSIWEDAVARLESFYGEIRKRGGMYHPMYWVDNGFLENPFFKNFWSQWQGIQKVLQAQSDTFYQFFTMGNKEKFQSFIADSPFASQYFTLFPDKWGIAAPEDLARRYYSYVSSFFLGSPGVLGPAMIQPDTSFLDPMYGTHVFARFNNNPLAETMKKYWNNSNCIKTEIKDQAEQPRLLIVAVDVQDLTTPVVFDSFAKKSLDEAGETCYSEYGIREYEKKPSGPKYRIEYPQGVSTEHVKASMATPLRFEYPSFEVTNLESEKKEMRTLWDGAFLANTPLRQLVQAHRDYWKEKPDTPDLEIFIVNLYPSIEEGVPSSPDAIQDRQTDITFHDRTKYELRVDKMRTDYIELLDDLIRIAKSQNGAEVEALLDQDTRKRKNDGTFAQKRELIEGRFKIKRVVYVGRTEKAGSTIFGKAFDFSPKTIKELMKKGEDAAKKAFDKCTEEYEKS